jgi:hypothetical protein
MRNEFVAITITATDITCGWFLSTQKHPLMLAAYESNSLARITGTHLFGHVQNFIRRHHLQHGIASVALSSPLMFEQFIRLGHASASMQDFLTPMLKKMLWHYRYVHSLDDGHHLFYLCALEQPIVFAYQLMMHKAGLNAVNLTSSYMGIVQGYRALFGPAFRQSQLALDMLKHEYALEQSMSADSIARLIHIPPTLSINLDQEKKSLLTMIGLFYQERNSHATYQFYKK